MFAIFEKYSCTLKDQKGKVQPIVLRKNIDVVFNDILKYLKDENYEDISSNRDVYDIFCTDMGFEISILLMSDIETTTINITVYGEHKRGKTRKKLKIFRALLLQHLKKIY